MSDGEPRDCSDMDDDVEVVDSEDASGNGAGYIDKELLISSIRGRPELWDMYLDGYKDRNQREEAWLEVYRCLNKGYDSYTAAKKKLYGKTVQTKWKNVKDAYRKYRNSITSKSGSGAKKRKRYIYGEKLTFLDKAGVPPDGATTNCPRISPEVILNTDVKLAQSGTCDVEGKTGYVTRKSLKLKRKKQQLAEVEDKCLDIQAEVKPQESPLDEHQSFFNSMLPTVRRFNEDEVLDFRAAVIQIAQDIKRRHNQL